MDVVKYLEIRKHWMDLRKHLAAFERAERLTPSTLDLIFYLGENGFDSKSNGVELSIVREQLGVKSDSLLSQRLTDLINKRSLALIDVRLNPEDHRYRNVRLTRFGEETYRRAIKHLDKTKSQQSL